MRRQDTIPAKPFVEPGDSLPKLSEAEAKQAADELGLVKFNVRRLRSAQRVGRWLRENGAAEVAHGLFLARLESLERIRSGLEGIFERLVKRAKTGEPESVKLAVDLAHAVAKLAEAENAAAGLQRGIELKSATTKRTGVALPAPGTLLEATTVGDGCQIKLASISVAEAG